MQTLIIGLDAFDPPTFERLVEQGRMPHLEKYLAAGGYARLAVANPPQSEVSWTSIATGLDPGGHGMFDFVHRDPATYALYVSLLPTRQHLYGTQFSPPFSARTLFEQATADGYPATSMWWPATFPARLESPVQTLPGLGTPDIQGRLGVGALYTTDIDLKDEKLKTPVEMLYLRNRGRYAGYLLGPALGKDGRSNYAKAEFFLDIREPSDIQLMTGKTTLHLQLGKWSPIFEVTFKVGPLMKLRALTRAILTHNGQDPRLYFLPMQIHPLNSPWRYGTPPGFIRNTWKSAGPFLTIGWPQDTTALEEGWIDDEQFLDLCESIDETRERALNLHLERFPEGVLACVFDTLDRVQHMFFHNRQDVIDRWYTRLDALVGRLEGKFSPQAGRGARLLVLSDHGFASFRYKVHLNRWLVKHGYLSLQDEGSERSLKAADWSRSKAYAIGLNSLYLNLAGREGKGIVTPAEKEALLREVCQKLLEWKGPDGRAVVASAALGEEAYNGPYAGLAPDLVVGYNPGYRASSDTGLGKWEDKSILTNKDHWGADHCIAPETVPGVLFSSRKLEGSVTYRDIPGLATGKNIEHKNIAPPKSGGGSSNEDEAVVEERLKSLGYL
jgi:predicted AlkP superfamily phosphohydrolase/phosphomutase